VDNLHDRTIDLLRDTLRFESLPYRSKVHKDIQSGDVSAEMNHERMNRLKEGDSGKAARNGNVR